jgi:hypothetical protein
VFFSYDAMVHLSQSPTLQFFCGQTKRDRLFSFVVPYRGQRKVFLKTINFIIENISKLHALHFNNMKLCFYRRDEDAKDAGFVFTHKHLSRMLSKVPEWSRLSDIEKQKMGLTIDDEREFWYVLLICLYFPSTIAVFYFRMPLEDFLGQYSQLCVCRLLSDSGAPPLSCTGTGDSFNWSENSLKGVWSTSRGGRMTPTQSLLQNPQFLINVPRKGSDVVIQLLQWSNDAVKEDLDYPAIGFTVLKVCVTEWKLTTIDSSLCSFHCLSSHFIICTILKNETFCM